MRVVQHLAELSGDRLQGEALYRRCRELLADPEKAAELLEVMGLDDDAS
jgi:type VI protein secretion system component VasF